MFHLVLLLFITTLCQASQAPIDEIFVTPRVRSGSPLSISFRPLVLRNARVTPLLAWGLESPSEPVLSRPSSVPAIEKVAKSLSGRPASAPEQEIVTPAVKPPSVSGFDYDLCTVCFERSKNTQMPCDVRHAYCKECVAKITNSRCPDCRAPFERTAVGELVTPAGVAPDVEPDGDPVRRPRRANVDVIGTPPPLDFRYGFWTAYPGLSMYRRIPPSECSAKCGRCCGTVILCPCMCIDYWCVRMWHAVGDLLTC